MFQKGHKGYNKGGSYKGKVDEREMQFLDFYYSQDSETKGSMVQSALKAGYSETTAVTKASRVIRRFGDAGAASSLTAMGVNKPYLASRIKQVLQQGSDKEILAAARLAYTLLGETTGEGGGATNVFNAPVMVIQGMTGKRMEALRGAIPQLSPEEEERLADERVAHNLELLKKGELPAHKPHSLSTGVTYTHWNKNDPNYREDLHGPKEVSVIDLPDDQGNLAPEPPAG